MGITIRWMKRRFTVATTTIATKPTPRKMAWVAQMELGGRAAEARFHTPSAAITAVTPSSGQGTWGNIRFSMRSCTVLLRYGAPAGAEGGVWAAEARANTAGAALGG